MTPEELELLAELGMYDDRAAGLNQQLGQAVSARRSMPQPQGSAWSRLGQNIGNAMGTIGSHIQESNLRGEQRKLIGRRQKARQLVGRLSATNGAPDEMEQVAQRLAASGDPAAMASAQALLGRSAAARKEAAEAPVRELNMKHTKAKIGKTTVDTEDATAKANYLAAKFSGEELAQYKAMGGKEDLSQLSRREGLPILERQLAIYKANKSGTGARAAGVAERAFENNIQKLGKDMDTIGRAEVNLKTLLAWANSPVKDIPGVGVFDSRLPDFWKSEQGSQVRMAALDMAFKLTKDDSGAAFTDHEWMNRLKAMGFGPTAGEKEFRFGIKRVAEMVRHQNQQRRAKYHPDVVQEYKSRGGQVDINVGGGDKDEMTIRDKKTKELFTGPRGPVPEGYEEVK